MIHDMIRTAIHVLLYASLAGFVIGTGFGLALGAIYRKLRRR